MQLQFMLTAWNGAFLNVCKEKERCKKTETTSSVFCIKCTTYEY